MPGSSPQGTLIGVILYLLYINPVGFPAEITENIEEAMRQMEEGREEENTMVQYLQPPQLQEPKLPDTMQTIKFVDDATIQEVIDLNTALASNRDRSGPLPYHESSGKILPQQNTLIQGEVDKIKRISDEREMVLNAKKTCVFIANFTENHQFKSMLSIPGHPQTLDIVLETKLLGYWLTSDLKPTTHPKPHIVG